MKNRKRLYVDKDVQGIVLRRVVFYWGACLLFIAVPLLIANAFAEPERVLYQRFIGLWNSYWPVFIISVLMLPFLLHDSLKISHTYVGPVFRLRNDLRAFLDGKKVDPITFRDDDQWKDLGDLVNQLVERVNVAESAKGQNLQDSPTISS